MEKSKIDDRLTEIEQLLETNPSEEKLRKIKDVLLECLAMKLNDNMRARINELLSKLNKLLERKRSEQQKIKRETSRDSRSR